MRPGPALIVATLAGLVVLAVAPAAPVRADVPPDHTTYDMTARYSVDANLDWKHGTLHVDSTMHIRNTSGDVVTRLELNTLPARLGAMVLDEVDVAGAPVTATVHDQTITVPLEPALEADTRVDVRVVYDARFADSGDGHRWMFAKLQGVAMAYRWIPWLSRSIPFKQHVHGDPFVTPVSPKVSVTITSDRRLVFATTGERTADDGLSQTFLARDVRDFNFTASPSFHVLTGLSGDGDTTIRVFTRWGDAHAMLGAARHAFDTYEARIGQYPYPEFDLSQTAAGTGQESPGLVWIPFYTPVLRYLVWHETAHQWFYSTVGNDQVTDPFADEALAEFLSRTFAYHLRGSSCAKARLDLGLYDYSVACYYEVIYIQGATFLDRLRRTMGDHAFWSTLRQYYAENTFAISSDKRLLEAFHATAGDGVLPRFHARFPSLF